MISVSVNYRLGVVGFLAIDALTEVDERGNGIGGNYGLLDTIAALEWVQRNIRAFGGDAARVTVYGQSSGGSIVLGLLASSQASGLFSSAISMSGSPRLNSTRAEANEYWHPQVVKQSRCASLVHAQSAKLRSCLLGLSSDELVQAMPENWDAAAFGISVFQSSYQYAPLLVIDGEGGLLPYNYLDPRLRIWRSTSTSARRTSSADSDGGRRLREHPLGAASS